MHNTPCNEGGNTTITQHYTYYYAWSSAVTVLLDMVETSPAAYYSSGTLSSSLIASSPVGGVRGKKGPPTNNTLKPRSTGLALVARCRGEKRRIYAPA